MRRLCQSNLLSQEELRSREAARLRSLNLADASLVSAAQTFLEYGLGTRESTRPAASGIVSPISHSCHPEPSEGSAVASSLEQQIPRAKTQRSE